jgi:hypothetical protein
VRVDEMADGEACALLTARLPALPPERVAAELADAVTALREEGITALDTAHADGRGRAVAATVEVRLGRLTPDEQGSLTRPW